MRGQETRGLEVCPRSGERQSFSIIVPQSPKVTEIKKKEDSEEESDLRRRKKQNKKKKKKKENQ